MALTHVLDTSVVKRLGRASVRDVVEPLAAAGQLARPGICDLEVGYSARNANITGQRCQWVVPAGSID